MIYNAGERTWLEAGSPHQGSVNIGLCQQPLDILGLHAASVKDFQPLSHSFSILLLNHVANELMDLLSELRCGRTPMLLQTNVVLLASESREQFLKLQSVTGETPNRLTASRDATSLL
jgi:hypothetical protein